MPSQHRAQRLVSRRGGPTDALSLTHNSAVFQAGGLVVVLVEVSRKAYLASIVPVIVNTILNEHQIVVDIVAFVNKGDFPRSRLGEKQRGKILAGWVTRKMRTVAQFTIRDDIVGMDGGDGPADHRASVSSMRSLLPGAGASSLRNMEHAPQILEQEELDHQMDRMGELPPGGLSSRNSKSGASLPPIDTNSASGGGHNFMPDFDRFGERPLSSRQQAGSSHNMPQIRLPGVDGREPEMIGGAGMQEQEHDDWTREAISK